MNLSLDYRCDNYFFKAIQVGKCYWFITPPPRLKDTRVWFPVLTRGCVCILMSSLPLTILPHFLLPSQGKQDF